MDELQLRPKDLETWAGYLLDLSLGGISSEDRVMIKGERVCWPLIEVLERRVIEAGGLPDIYLVAPNNDRGRIWSAAMARFGSREQMDRVPSWARQRYESMTKYIEVFGSESPESYRALTPEQLRGLTETYRPFMSTRFTKRWTMTLFPTPAQAAIEGMSAERYAQLIVRASTTDPTGVRESEERLAPLIEGGRQLTVVTEHPLGGRELVLRMDISMSRPVLGYGLVNFPDGEIYTSPDARSPEGEIFVDLPVTHNGNDLAGIYLRLEGGRIVEHTAQVGQDHLTAIIETDEGSHRLGEIALGMNPGLDRVLKHPLYVEKVGGTLHIAIGLGYEECFVEDPGSEAGRSRIAELERAGALNRSAQHIDIVTDFRPGGCGRRVLIDDIELEPSAGSWAVKGQGVPEAERPLAASADAGASGEGKDASRFEGDAARSCRLLARVDAPHETSGMSCLLLQPEMSGSGG